MSLPCTRLRPPIAIVVAALAATMAPCLAVTPPETAASQTAASQTAALDTAAPETAAPETTAPNAPTPGETSRPADTVTIAAHYEAAGAHDVAASEGRVTRSLILQRPTARPAELLEFVPGVIVTQHSGSGKANQYFLRGFNLDHGTDFATHVDGMPVNMPSHAHGQGYTDLNFVIPELVRSIDFRKGPYATEDGDFASAGSARIALVDALPRPFSSLTLGQRGYARLLQAGSTQAGPGTLLGALELGRDDGPWDTPQGLRRVNALLRYRLADGDTQQTLTAMAYQSRWRSTDQVPLRALEDGRVGRFGAIDPSDRGETGRYSLSWNLLALRDDGEWQASAWLLRSRVSLYSNFTYALDRPATGDQFLQAETREALGGSVARVWQGGIGGRRLRTTLGLQWRHDRLDPVGLYDAQDAQPVGTVQESRVRQSSVALYGQSELRWTSWLRTTAGLRVDRYRFDVASSVDGNGGRRDAGLASPRVSAVLGPWRGTEFFASAGRGLHSNDARGVLARVDPRSGDAVEPAAPLVRTRGAEVGLRATPLPGLQTTVSVWRLALDSELVFAGDAGTTAPSAASTRQGLELGLHWKATRHLAIDAEFALSQARFDRPVGDAGRDGREVPGAVRQVMSLGATLADAGPWSAQLQLRWFGPRPLVEDGSVRSQGTLLASGRIGYRVSRDVRLTLDAFNLFDRRASDIDYFYVSRLPGEPAGGIADRHLHPVEPRTLRLGVIVEH